jgi:SAM-dependent MidA family methyltransferase
LLAGGPEAPEGAILEVSPSGEALAGEIARRIAAAGGAALIVDYGYAAAGPGKTLQAVRRHAFVDPLAAPGEADLTAHVDFAALARQAEAAGAAVHGPIEQGAFLLSLGLRERAERLGATADASKRGAVVRAVERLAGAEGMGELFKVLALTRLGVTPPPFGPKI